jgi:hypothetical protein
LLAGAGDVWRWLHEARLPHRCGAPQTGTPRYSEWHDHFIFGLINTDGEVDIKSICPSGNATIVNYVSFLNGLLTYLLSGWIWTPTTVDVYCAEGEATHSVPVSEESARAIIHAAEFKELVAQYAPAQLDRVMAALELPAASAVCASR